MDFPAQDISALSSSCFKLLAGDHLPINTLIDTSSRVSILKCRGIKVLCTTILVMYLKVYS